MYFFCAFRLSYGVEHLPIGVRQVAAIHSHTACPMVFESVTSQNTPKAVKVLLVDDQQYVRTGLRLLLQLEPGTTVIGEAGNGAEAMALAGSLHPDLIIMDVEMPGLDGITSAHRCVDLLPGCVVIMLSIHSRPEMRERALAAGAWAFVEKGKPQELRDTLRRAIGALDSHPSN